MIKKRRNIYLDALEYGEEQLSKRQPIESRDLKKYLKDKGYKFSTREEERLLNDLGREAFQIHFSDPSNRKYYLNIEGYFKLLEYRELNDARKSSKEAKQYAVAAIVIATITLLVSIYFSNKVLKQEMVIDSEQFKVIENIWHYLHKQILMSIKGHY